MRTLNHLLKEQGFVNVSIDTFTEIVKSSIELFMKGVHESSYRVLRTNLVTLVTRLQQKTA